MSNPFPDPESHRTAEFEEDEGDGSERSLLVPILLALFAMLVIAATVIYYTYHKSFATGVMTTTVVYPIHTQLNTNGQMAGGGGEDDLYLLPVIKVQDHITLPLFIESLAADVTTADGAAYHCTAAQPGDFTTMFAAYPDLSHAVELTGDSPMLRDTRIESNGGGAHGLVMVHFPISMDAWQHRKSASVTVSFYHQPPLVIPFPADQ